jgi:hypothetical protein
LDSLKPADLKKFQAELFDYNNQRESALATSGFTERLVAFSATRDELPEQFAKLGVTSNVSATDLYGAKLSQPVPVKTELEFNIEAPEQAGWHGSYFTEIRAFFGPNGVLDGSPGDGRISLRITKGTDSLFFKADGRKENAVRFEHEAVVREFDYFPEACAPASTAVTESDLVRYSPYGRWKVELLNQDIDPKVLMKIDQIHFQMRIRQLSVPNLQPGVSPIMFENDGANDPEAYPNGIVVINEEQEGCQPDVSHIYLGSARGGGDGATVYASAAEVSSSVAAWLVPLLIIALAAGFLYHKSLAGKKQGISSMLEAAFAANNAIMLKDQAPSYLRGQISRQTAEALLKKGVVGAFVVRDKADSEVRVISVVLRAATEDKKAKFKHEEVTLASADNLAEYGEEVYGGVSDRVHLIKNVPIGNPPATSLRQALAHLANDDGPLGVLLVGIDETYGETGVMGIEESQKLYQELGEEGWSAGNSDYNPTIYGDAVYGQEAYTPNANQIYSIPMEDGDGNYGGDTIYSPAQGGRPATVYADGTLYGGDTIYNDPNSGTIYSIPTDTTYGGDSLYSTATELSGLRNISTGNGANKKSRPDTIYAIPMENALGKQTSTIYAAANEEPVSRAANRPARPKTVWNESYPDVTVGSMGGGAKSEPAGVGIKGRAGKTANRATVYEASGETLHQYGDPSSGTIYAIPTDTGPVLSSAANDEYVQLGVTAAGKGVTAVNETSLDYGTAVADYGSSNTDYTQTTSAGAYNASAAGAVYSTEAADYGAAGAIAYGASAGADVYGASAAGAVYSAEAADYGADYGPATGGADAAVQKGVKRGKGSGAYGFDGPATTNSSGV